MFIASSLHDNALYALRLRAGDPERDDWRGELVLDIDHIVEWVCGTDRRVRFLVAPATLTFHNVTDLRIAVDFGDSGHRVVLNALSIDRITREPVQDRQIRVGHQYYRWRIALNRPQGGEVAFGASHFTQSLRAEAVLLDEQSFSPVDRP